MPGSRKYRWLSDRALVSGSMMASGQPDQYTSLAGLMLQTESPEKFVDVPAENVSDFLCTALPKGGNFITITLISLAE